MRVGSFAYPETGSVNLVRPMTCQDYKDGNNLSPEARRIINDIGDLWRISLIDNVQLPSQVRIGYGVSALNRKHYAESHAVWIHGEKMFLGMNLGREPSDFELAEDFQITHVPERFRMFYLLTHPDKMAVAEHTYNGELSLLSDFLGLAEQISGITYCNKFMRVQLVPAFGKS